MNGKNTINFKINIGVLCVPSEIAYDVLLRAEQIESNENEIFDWIRSGDIIQEIVYKGGYF